MFPLIHKKSIDSDNHVIKMILYSRKSGRNPQKINVADWDSMGTLSSAFVFLLNLQNLR